MTEKAHPTVSLTPEQEGLLAWLRKNDHDDGHRLRLDGAVTITYSIFSRKYHYDYAYRVIQVWHAVRALVQDLGTDGGPQEVSLRLASENDPAVGGYSENYVWEIDGLLEHLGVTITKQP